MADTDRIKRNLAKMIEQKAPEADLNSYLKTEGFNSPEEWRSAVLAPTETPGGQDFTPRQFTGAEKAARVVGQGATGFNDAVANTLGAPVDAVSWAMRQAGVPVNNALGGSESIKKGIDYVATLPGRVVDAAQQGSVNPLTEDRTSRFAPVGTWEKAAYGAGEGAGNALSMIVPAAAVANTARAGTVAQGVANALATQPITQTVAGAVGGGVTGATDNPWLGLAAGAAVPIAASIGRGLVSPTTNVLRPQEQRIIAAADREGIDLTPAQRTGSRGLRGAEAAMSNLPLSSGPMQGRFDQQRQQLNQAVLGRAGIAANEASPAVMDPAYRNIGQTFDDLARRTTVNADPRLAADVQAVANDYGRRLDTNVAPIFRSYMDDLQPLLQAATTLGANPQLDGQMYARIRSDIGRSARETNVPSLRRALNGLMESLDDAMQRSATTPALQQEWRDARRNYAMMTIIDKAMQGGTQADRQAGNIPLAALRQAVRSADTTGYSRGRGELNEISRIADYLSNKIPDSGTMPRAAWANLLTGGALFGGGMSAGASIPAAAVGAATPWLASRAYNSSLGQRYLTNQLTGNTDFRALYAGQAARQARTEIEGGPNALSQRGGQ